MFHYKNSFMNLFKYLFLILLITLITSSYAANIKTFPDTKRTSLMKKSFAFQNLALVTGSALLYFDGERTSAKQIFAVLGIAVPGFLYLRDTKVHSVYYKDYYPRKRNQVYEETDDPDWKNLANEEEDNMTSRFYITTSINAVVGLTGALLADETFNKGILFTVPLTALLAWSFNGLVIDKHSVEVKSIPLISQKGVGNLLLLTTTF